MVIAEQTDLLSTVKETIRWYEAEGYDPLQFFRVFDEDEKRFTICTFSQHERVAEVFVLVQVVEHIVVIYADGPDDKPVHAALMNQGIPREQIILAYRGETIKSQDEA